MRLAEGTRIDSGDISGVVLTRANALDMPTITFRLLAQRVRVERHRRVAAFDGLRELRVRSFDERCARGLAPDERVIAEHVERSLMLVTALVPHIGYEKAARISLTAYREHLSLREAALKLRLVSAEDFDRWVRPEAMTRPGNG